MLRKTVVARALSIAFSGVALSAAVVAPVMAQSNASGSIYGRADAAAGATINVTSTETGLKRSMTADANGRFQFTSMPIGHYKVEMVKNGKVQSTTEVDVFAGQGVDANFAPAATSTVLITGRRSRIDVSNTNNGATFTAKELNTLPVARNVDAIIQLAPNTTTVDSRYGGGASIGGGAASENAYYINGFPVTNPLTQLGGAELPFGAIAQASVLTGGFGAEFGRSAGGVVNITTKSGTNNWEAGVMTYIDPSGMRGKYRDIYYANTGANALTDNTLYLRRSDNTLTQKMYGAYVGGPLIKDKLFAFISAEETQSLQGLVTGTTAANQTNVQTSGYTKRDTSVRRHMEKVDWNITDDHRLEFTFLGDNTYYDDRLQGYNYATHAVNGNVVSTQHFHNPPASGNGIDAQIWRYVGNLTDNLTLTVLSGRSKSDHTNTFDGYDINKPLYQITQTAGAGGHSAAFPGFNYTSPQFLSGTIIAPGAQDQIKSNRVDLEWKLGDHTLRAGLDDNKLISLNAGEMYAGGGIWNYRWSTPGSKPTLPDGTVPTIGAGAPAGSPYAQGYYVREIKFNTVTNTYSNQSAQYIEDRWQATKNLLITGGLRIEQMENLNGDQQVFLKVKKQYNPRLSASWDVNGDSTFKVFGSAGRYSLQIPTHISVRGASRSLNTTQYFTYTGTDANGNPTGLQPITAKPFSSNNEYYQQKDYLSVAAKDIKPTYQDEITLGLEKSYSPSLTFGAKFTYRTLKSTIDDWCDGGVIDAWAAKNNVSEANYDGFGCASFNPGMTNTFLIDFNNANPALAGKSHTEVTIPWSDFGMPKPKRIYEALDVFAEHPYRDGWYGKINYTWSKNTGNTEGQTLSDVGQTDVAATQTWDFSQIMEYADGLLPNNRTHQIKAFGYWDITPEWTVGANTLLASGRPKNCLGEYPLGGGKYTGFGYGSSFHYCNGVPSPRGTAGTLPWTTRLDLNVAYKAPFLKGLQFKVNVFNVMNKQIPQTVNEQYNDGSGGNVVSTAYGRVISYTSPRYVRFTAQYDVKF